MFNDDDGIAPLHQTVQQLHDLFHIGGVEAGGGLVQHINAAFFVQLLGELDPLALAAGQSGQGLSQRQVGQAHLQHGPQGLAQFPVLPKEFIGFPGGHIQNLHNVLAPIGVGQGLLAVAFSLAGLTNRGHRVHKHQLRDDLSPAAAAGAAALAVEGEQGRLHTVFRCHHLSDFVKESQEGCGGGASGGRHRRLVDQHHPVGVFPGKHVPDQRAFAGARHARNRGEYIQRNVHVHILQIVDTGIAHRQKCPGLPGRGLQGFDVLHRLAGFCTGAQQGLIAALKQNPSAVFARLGAHIDDLVGNGDHVPVMLHNQHRVAPIPKIPQEPGHPVYIPGMHSGAGLVKNVGHTRQGASHIPHQLQPLGLSPGQGGRFPVHGKIGQADVDHPGKGCRQRVHDGFCSGVGNGVQHRPELRKLHGAHLINAAARHLAGKGSGIQPASAAVGADLLLQKLIELAQGVVILLLRAFHKAQPLELGFDALHPLVYPGTAGFPGAEQEQIPFFRRVIPVLLVQVEEP